MKTITLRIPSVEAAMLQDLQKTHKQFRNLEALVLGLIRQEYQKTPAGKTSKQRPDAPPHCPDQNATYRRGIPFTSRLGAIVVSF